MARSTSSCARTKCWPSSTTADDNEVAIQQQRSRGADTEAEPTGDT